MSKDNKSLIDPPRVELNEDRGLAPTSSGAPMPRAKPPKQPKSQSSSSPKGPGNSGAKNKS